MAYGTVGTGISSPSALLVGTLNAVAQKLIYPRFGDLVFKPGTTLWYLNRYAKKFDAGGEIVYPLITSKLPTRGSFYGDQLLNTAAFDAIIPADQVWRFYYTSITLPLSDIVLGRGGPAGMELVRAYTQLGAASMLDMLADAIWGNSPFNTSIDLDNISNWLGSTTNTIAGISRTATPAWAPPTPQTVSGHLSPTTLLPAYFTVTFGYDEPDLIVLNNTDYANFELQFTATAPASAAPTNIIRAQESVADTTPIQTGFRYHMRFKNAVVLADQHLTAGTGYVINTQYMWMIYNMGDHFSMTPWLMPTNQAVISSRITVCCQLGCNRPLSGIQLASIS